MNWKIIKKNPANQPKKGTYRDWKPLIAEEGFNQCVYCAIPENSMGGIRNFHVEHYRPKSIFVDQENDYCNLFYACPICNSFKSNDWPCNPPEDNSKASYPNPSEVDYNLLFDLDSQKGLIYGKNIAAKYVQEKMYLNRPQLRIERRLQHTVKRGIEEIEKTRTILDELQDDAEYRALNMIFQSLWLDLSILQEKLQTMPRYSMDDIKRLK